MRDQEAEQQERFTPERVAHSVCAFKVTQLSLPDSAYRRASAQSASCKINEKVCEEKTEHHLKTELEFSSRKIC